MPLSFFLSLPVCPLVLPPSTSLSLYTGYLSRSKEKTVETSYDYYENANPVSKCQQGGRAQGRASSGRAYMAYSPAHSPVTGRQTRGTEMEGSPVGSAEISEISMRHVNRSARRGRQGRPEKAREGTRSCLSRQAGWQAGLDWHFK